MTSMMTVWGPACAIVGFLSVGGATETRAAYWNYACKGTIGKATLLFDRSYLLIMPTKLAQGGVLGIRDGSIATFESADANSGLAPTMVFSPAEIKRSLWLRHRRNRRVMMHGARPMIDVSGIARHSSRGIDMRTIILVSVRS